MPEPRCKDCFPAGHGTVSSMVPKTVRPAPHPGPRCTTHHRVKVKADKAAAAERRNERVYSLGPGDYDRLYAFQGGVCALCRVATGKARRLAVDHDHACCSGPTSCGNCVRGLLCSVDNKLLGHIRDDHTFLLRAVDYLKDPPAKRLAQQALQAAWDRQ